MPVSAETINVKQRRNWNAFGNCHCLCALQSLSIVNRFGWVFCWLEILRDCLGYLIPQSTIWTSYPFLPAVSLPSAQLSSDYLMSLTQSAAASSSNFELVINNALNKYKKRTKKDLLTHPLSAQLHTCDTPAAILTILQEQVQELGQSRSNDDRWLKWLDPTVNVLFAFSGTLGAGVSLVCCRTPAHPISALSYLSDRHFHPRV